jgi:hypothetical protein
LLRKAMTRADGYDNDGERTLSPMIQSIRWRDGLIRLSRD